MNNYSKGIITLLKIKYPELFSTEVENNLNLDFMDMSIAGQRLQSNRYTVIPRTLSFLLYEGAVLLIRIAEDRGPWAGCFNGIGGHVEQGEDPLTSALREIKEETGLSATDLKLCGVVIVNMGDNPGIGLYVFVGRAEDGSLHNSNEGSPFWVPIDQLGELPLVEDLPILLPKAIESYQTEPPFSAIYSYSETGELTIRFHS